MIETKKGVIGTKKGVIGTKKGVIGTKKGGIETKKGVIETKKGGIETKKRVIETPTSADSFLKKRFQNCRKKKAQQNNISSNRPNQQGSEGSNSVSIGQGRTKVITLRTKVLVTQEVAQ